MSDDTVTSDDADDAVDLLVALTLASLELSDRISELEDRVLLLEQPEEET